MNIMALLLVPFAQDQAAVLTGLEVLARDGFRPLEGKRVGLVTNHTGITRDGRHIIDLFHEAKNFRLTALFSPEHGLRGTADTHVASGRDEKTGLLIHSLYGKTKKPTPEMLKEVDVLVFDIQDIGARFYTYITTMALCMEAAKENDKAMVVLDRPNPIGGEAVEGPVLEDRLTGGFASYYPIPTRHGMTVGELALFFNTEFKIGCKLQVIRMEGWRRSMYFDQTKLPWINPSPNMRSLTAAIHYPGLGSLEATNLSVGRGTDTPFHVYGAPWIDAERLVADLNARRLPGVTFKAVTFTPRRIEGMPKYPHTDSECRGFEPVITDRTAYQPVRTVVHVLDALHRLHAKEFDFGGCPNMIGRSDVGERLRRGEKPDEIVNGWDLSKFKSVRARYLLYP